MKKYLKLIVAGLCLALGLASLTACGGSGGGEKSEPTLCQTECFSFMLPAGWNKIDTRDYTGEKDEEGNFPVNPAMVYVSKEAKGELEVLAKPSILLTYYNLHTTVMSAKSWYENTEDLDIQIDGAEVIEAYEGDSTIYDGFRYQIIWFKTADAQFYVTIPSIQDGKETGLSWESEDVFSIIQSLSAVPEE